MIDMMMPIYRGATHETFDPKHLAVLVIQVQNRPKKTPVDVVKRKDFCQSLFATESSGMPVIVLTMDLSCQLLDDDTFVEPALSCRENVFAFHLSGHTSATFKCIPESAGFWTLNMKNKNRKLRVVDEGEK